jgi:hypothetical protein
MYAIQYKRRPTTEVLHAHVRAGNDGTKYMFMRLKNTFRENMFQVKAWSIELYTSTGTILIKDSFETRENGREIMKLKWS